MSGLALRLARPKYFSNTSHPFRTTSNPPFCVQRCVKSHARSRLGKSMLASSRACAALVAPRQPPELSGGGKYAPGAVGLSPAAPAELRMAITKQTKLIIEGLRLINIKRSIRAGYEARSSQLRPKRLQNYSRNAARLPGQWQLSAIAFARREGPFPQLRSRQADNESLP